MGLYDVADDIVVTESFAKRAYNYLNLDDSDKKIGGMLEEEMDFIKKQRQVFGSPYRGTSVVSQFMAIFLHLTKFVKNIVSCVGMLFLALVAALNDWSVANKLLMMAAGRAVLVALNLANTLFALTAFFVNGVQSIVKGVQSIFSSKEKLDSATIKENETDKENQTDFNVKVHDSFFKSTKVISKKYDTTEKALKEVNAEMKEMVTEMKIHFSPSK